MSHKHCWTKASTVKKMSSRWQTQCAQQQFQYKAEENSHEDLHQQKLPYAAAGATFYQNLSFAISPILACYKQIVSSFNYDLYNKCFDGCLQTEDSFISD